MNINNRRGTHYCKDCGYRSNRRFNVERHAKRIHGKSITKKCCDISFFKKSDYYHHIEDHHPHMRSSCSISKDKYKIYSRKLKLTGFCSKTSVTNTVNSSVISGERTVIRKSMRIQKKIAKTGKLSLKEVSTESECDECDDEGDDDMDIDYYDFNEYEELTHDLHHYKKMNSLSSMSDEYDNSRCDESENNDNSTRRYEESNSNTGSRLPLKKRILSEINNNIGKSSILKSSEVKINNASFSGKENQNTIDIFLNGYQGATIVKKILTIEQSMQMWNDITQCQRNYLKSIDFDSF